VMLVGGGSVGRIDDGHGQNLPIGADPGGVPGMAVG
jgi:hypothetical protein